MWLSFAPCGVWCEAWLWNKQCAEREKRHVDARNKNRHYSRDAIDVKLFRREQPFRRESGVPFREIPFPVKRSTKSRSRNELCSRDFRVIRGSLLPRGRKDGTKPGNHRWKLGRTTWGRS